MKNEKKEKEERGSRRETEGLSTDYTKPGIKSGIFAGNPITIVRIHASRLDSCDETYVTSQRGLTQSLRSSNAITGHRTRPAAR